MYSDMLSAICVFVFVCVWRERQQVQGGRAGHGKECLKWKCLAVCVCARPCGHCVIKGFHQRLIERPSSLSSSKSWTAKNTLAIHRKHNKERVRHMCAKCIDCRQRPQCIMGMYYVCMCCSVNIAIYHSWLTGRVTAWWLLFRLYTCCFFEK